MPRSKQVATSFYMFNIHRQQRDRIPSVYHRLIKLDQIRATCRRRKKPCADHNKIVRVRRARSEKLM